ncbi:predicted protein, partial [Nematostella vectensis]
DICRRVIVVCSIKSVGLFNAESAISSLPLPRALLESLTASVHRPDDIGLSLCDSFIQIPSPGKHSFYGERVVLKCIRMPRKWGQLCASAKKFKEDWTRVRHRNISKVILCFEKDYTIGAIFEPVSCTVYDRVQIQKSSRKFIDECHIWRVISQLADVLNYLCKLDIPHSSLTTLRMSVTSNWDLRLHNMLLYFETSNHAVIDRETFYGIYSSPETLRGSKSDKNDPWLVGCVGYELMHLETAYHYSKGVSPFVVLESIVQGKPPPKWMENNGYSNDLAELVRWCLAHNSALRPSLKEISAKTKALFNI